MFSSALLPSSRLVSHRWVSVAPLVVLSSLCFDIWLPFHLVNLPSDLISSCTLSLYVVSHVVEKCMRRMSIGKVGGTLEHVLLMPMKPL